MPYTPILGTLGYILSADASQTLMIHRNARPDDQHLGKYNGLGGKLERDEDIATGMIREIREEAGIEVTQMTLRGTVNWPGFGKQGEDWLGFIFLITAFDGAPKMRNEEGTLEWVAVSRVLQACDPDPAVRDAAQLPMWAGDRYFLPLVFRGAAGQFHAHMPYQHGQPTDWAYRSL